MQAGWDCVTVQPSSRELAEERHGMGMAAGKQSGFASCCTLLRAESCVAESNPCLCLDHLRLAVVLGAGMAAAGVVRFEKPASRGETAGRATLTQG